MDVSVEEFVDRLLSDEGYQGIDSGKFEELDDDFRLPKWFDQKKFNQGRKFFWDHRFGFFIANALGFISVFSIPTIPKVVVGTRRSSSSYTSYKRLFSTYLHSLTWFQYDLKPGTVSWKSLQTVRRRHLKAGRAARLKGQGRISQRDVALTMFCNFGLVILKPDTFSVRQRQEGDWESFIHVWRVLGHMIGLQERYNICLETFEETRQVFQRIKERVHTPCLENVPEYFEHLIHVALDGLGSIAPGLEKTSLLFFTKYIADVPGYIYTESDRIAFQDKLRKHLQGKSSDAGVESTALIEKSAIDGLPELPPRVFYLDDFSSIENVPAYKALSFIAKYNLAVVIFMLNFYSTNIGRLLLNFYIQCILFFAKYFPCVAMWRFGIRNAFVNIFKESPVDETVPRLNSEYYKLQRSES